MDEKVIIEFINLVKNEAHELEIPVSITSNELIKTLNEIYNLKMDLENLFSCYLISENPVAFLRGNKLLSEYGIHNGTRIIYKGE